jgi:hypothetical protein
LAEKNLRQSLRWNEVPARCTAAPGLTLRETMDCSAPVIAAAAIPPVFSEGDQRRPPAICDHRGLRF